MSQQEHNLQINYIEFPATDIEETKRFYGDVFGWKFQDYGPDYTSFFTYTWPAATTPVPTRQASASPEPGACWW
jgi:predicted enzyme related to lactoylglutathione lyase